VGRIEGMAVAGSLRALAEGLIDYAGLFPPAGLPLAEVAERYEAYRESKDKWMLNRLVLPAGKLAEARLGGGWRVSLLVDADPGALPRQVETLETKLTRRLSLPTYCEAPLEMVTDGFAKVRTGGLTPDAIPAVDSLCRFFRGTAERRLAFKATAGLHHAVRSMRALTYAPDSPRAVMHGFLNVFVAAAFVWHGDGEAVSPVLLEEDPRAFLFGDDELRWRGRRLSTAQLREARRDYAHSFGSCSFEEPVEELREMGLMA
jgi:hypothetical protein